jgi:hypothetical protein
MPSSIRGRAWYVKRRMEDAEKERNIVPYANINGNNSLVRAANAQNQHRHSKSVSHKRKTKTKKRKVKGGYRKSNTRRRVP